jgi:cytoskeletal protein RodZ
VLKEKEKKKKKKKKKTLNKFFLSTFFFFLLGTTFFLGPNLVSFNRNRNYSNSNNTAPSIGTIAGRGLELSL